MQIAVAKLETIPDTGAMPVLDLDDIRRDACAKIEIAEKARELQALVSRWLPGHRVFIVSPDEAASPLPRRRPTFESMSGTEQIAHVLSLSADGMMEIGALHREILARGGSMSPETMMSYLSRGKDEIFTNPIRGHWGLVPPSLAGRRTG